MGDSKRQKELDRIQELAREQQALAGQYKEARNIHKIRKLTREMKWRAEEMNRLSKGEDRQC